MKRVLLGALLFLANVSWAGPIEDAANAFARGDFATELRITRRLAVKGEAWAQYNLGVIYENGIGVGPNLP